MEFLENIEFKYGDCDTDRLPKRLIWDRSFKIDSKSMDPKNPNRGKYQHSPDYGIQVFTDGSLDPKDGIAGSGVNIGLGLIKLSYNIGEKSVFLAEIFAIKKACQWILHNRGDFKGKKVTIFCDSQAALKSLQKIEVTSKCVLRTIDLLNGLGNILSDLTLTWVRSHTGECSGNSVADDLANEGRLLPEVATDAPKTPWALIKSDLIKKVNAYWSFMWMQQNTCRQSKDFFPKVDYSRSFELLTLTRKQWSKIVALMTGHCGLARHLFLCSDPFDEESTPPTCPRCEEDDDTARHYFSQCPALYRIRQEIFGHAFMEPPFDDLKINKILQFMSRSKVQAMQWAAPNKEPIP